MCIFTQVWAALSQPSVYLPLAFLFVWQGTPSSESAFFYFRTSHTQQHIRIDHPSHKECSLPSPPLTSLPPLTLQ